MASKPPFSPFAPSAEILMDVDDIFSLPFGVGAGMQDAADFIPRARQSDKEEYLLPPLLIPKVARSC